jgi:cytochrome c oxidase assembly factor CtaG
LKVVAAAASASATPALAHALPPTGSGTGVPALLFALIAVAAALYARGIRRIWRRTGYGRGIRAAEAISFATGIALIALLLSSPIESATERSFAAHMIQHEVLMLAIAPLLVAGRPLAAWAWALPRSGRARAGQLFAMRGWRVPWAVMTSLAGATTLQLAVLAAWHIPAAFDGAVAVSALHALQHASFLGSALAFCWALIKPAGRDRAWQRALALFVTMIGTGALGALLSMARHPWYAAYATAHDPLADQQLGGLVMWIPGGTVYALAALAIVMRWFARAPRAALPSIAERVR